MRRFRQLVLLSALSLALGVPASGDEPSPDSLRVEIDALRPARLAWREVEWRECPLAAFAEARATGRPVIVWVFLGNPSDERC